MKFFNLILRSLSMVFVLTSLFVGCQGEELDPGIDGYGYVQFHLFKAASYSKADPAKNMLDYLSDAAKVKVTLKTSSNDILSSTVTVDAPDKELAEWGMQTDKFKLVSGDYTLLSFQVLDALDNPVFNSGNLTEDNVIRILPGGLVTKDLLVDVTERGKVNFILVKGADAVPQVKSAGDADYPFYMIQSADVTIRNIETDDRMKIENLPMVHEFSEEDDYVTGICRTDTLVSVPGGKWEVIEYKTYFDYARKVFKTITDVEENSFEVTDNAVVDSRVPVSIDLTTTYIQDAMTLKKIYDKMNGSTWKVKWNFDCDVDIWSAQPGVYVLEDGRIAQIDFEGLGATGAIPAEIGDLSELRSLLLGSHSFFEGNSNLSIPAGRKYTPLSREELRKRRQSFTETFVNNTDAYSSFSEEMRLALKLNGVQLKESDTPLRQYPGPESSFNYATGITSLPDEINKLKKLTTLSIGYSPLVSLPEDMSGLESLTDMEMFYLPELTEFPLGIATLPKLQTLTFSCNYNVPPDLMYKGLVAMNDGNVNKSLQALYIPGQPLEKVPDLTNIKTLALLNIQDCGADEFVKPFGKNHYFVNLYADNNKFSSLPVDDYGYFVGIDSNTETIGFAHNEFTEMPDIFDAKSVYSMGTMDFSHNKIKAFVGHNGGPFRGLNASTLNLSYNELESWPRELSTSESAVQSLMLQGNKIAKIEKEDITHKYSYLTTTIDLSYNLLKSLPAEFDVVTFPFLYGLDLSYNRFTAFPYAAVHNQNLTVFIFRHQRDEFGRRCMKEWPTGIGGALVGLRALYLGSNDIRVVNDELSYLIYNLDISDNPNIMIDVTSICGYIASGFFNLIYSPDQDIRGCDDYLNLN